MLKVLARGMGRLPAMHKHPAREWVGWKVELIDGAPHLVKLEVPSEVPELAEYMMAVRDGSLWAADEATAKKCNVKYDPTYGNELKPDAAEAEEKG